MTAKMLQTRTHNERATNSILHGHEAKYIDTEKEKTFRAVEARQNG